MIYLILEMLVALSLAALSGGALGWLVHRATYNKQVHELQQRLTRQQNHLKQSQSEVAMLSEDYDEMHRRSQEELEALRKDNQQIPFLSSNLEKSQLLVRQMMQKHEAKIRDLTTENQKLTSRVRSTEVQEQAQNKIQAELDGRRREKKRLSDDQAETTISEEPVSDKTSPSTLSASPRNSLLHQTIASSAALTDASAGTVSEASAQISNASAGTVPEVSAQISNAKAGTVPEASVQISNARPSGSWASTPLAKDSTQGKDQIRTLADNDADADPFDEVMEVGDDLQRELSSAATEGAESDNPAEHSATLESSVFDGTAPEAGTLEIGDHSWKQQDTSLLSANSANTEQMDFELPDLENDLNKNDLLDGGTDASSLFDPVEQRDDLKQIFGIGPVTEKALNDMGITSYSQLADLKHHEVQSIADTLQIVPGRIERDDWVGNARRQLEDVLEQL